MKLHLSRPKGIHLFTAYGEGYVAVDHQRHEHSLILLPDRIIENWTPSHPDTLNETDLRHLLELHCEIILLGTGQQLRFPSPHLMAPFASAGIGLDIMDLQAACRTYNILAAESRNVAAALVFDPPKTSAAHSP